MTNDELRKLSILIESVAACHRCPMGDNCPKGCVSSVTCVSKWRLYLKEALNRVPSEENPWKWIPCRKKIPDIPTGEKYYNLYGEDIAAEEYIVMIEGATQPTSLFWTEKSEWWDVYNEEQYKVTAWTYFPEPYLEEEEGEKE